LGKLRRSKIFTIIDNYAQPSFVIELSFVLNTKLVNYYTKCTRGAQNRDFNNSRG